METKHILVVDDENDLCDILNYNLTASGYQVSVAHSAEETLQRLSECEAKGYEFDLMLVDVMLPGMSGFLLVKRIKESIPTANIPIIFLTAKDEENDMLRGFSLGADDYITKPFSVREVMARVKAVLNRSGAYSIHTEGTFSYEGLVIDLNQKSVRVDGEVAPVTKTEFDILMLLLTNMGRVFSRHELLMQVWGRDDVVSDRTIDVNITRMRKKIGRYASRVVTRQGFGYVFEESGQV